MPITMRFNLSPAKERTRSAAAKRNCQLTTEIGSSVRSSTEKYASLFVK